MSLQPNPNDSWWMDELRLRYARSSGRRAMPARLGAYAASTGVALSEVDYGAHSARWRRRFEAGYDSATTSRFPVRP